ncbi:MAG: GntR family transcriptional regulator [Tissierellales bacterium]|nr:GntR family transcriptional regulator [Tissierellales bacterium]MBN2827522.1 GntR family transcriptional regulator [Tissierellales bacterium]
MPQSRLTIREKIVNYLRNAILVGEYEPGQRIIEAEIADYFKVSRGPIRESIRQLEQEGLLEYQRNKGCKVKILTPDEAWEIYLLRSNLESLSIKVLNGNIGEKYLKGMRKAVNEMKFYGEEMDIIKLVEKDHEFHSQIIKACQMERIENLWSSLNGTSFAIFLTVAKIKSDNLPLMAERHQQLLDVIMLNNVENSCKEIEKHYLSTGRILYLKS